MTDGRGRSPTLYLKWRAFRALIPDTRSDADFARIIFEDEQDAGILFTRLIYGDTGMRRAAADALIDAMNTCIHGTSYRSLVPPSGQLSTSDLDIPVFEFVRRLVAVAGPLATDGSLDAAHARLLASLTAPQPAPVPRLVVKRFSVDRMLAGMEPSGGVEAPVFQPGRHRGQIVVEGVERDPHTTFAFVVRDPKPIGQHLWDLKWGETVLWLPSPIRTTRSGSTLSLMPAPTEVQPVFGRFLVTAVMAADEEAAHKLDPRGSGAAPHVLDEPGTARFLTVLRRLASRDKPPVQVATGGYVVEAPAWRGPDQPP